MARKDKEGTKDMQPQGKSRRTARGQASPGGSGSPPTQAHQAAGGKKQVTQPGQSGKTAR